MAGAIKYFIYRAEGGKGGYGFIAETRELTYDDDGSISFINLAQMKGWIVVGNPDPLDINWISFFVRAPETAPNSGYARASPKTLVAVNPAAGALHVQVTAPENLAGFQTGSQTHELVMRRPIDAEIDGEGVQLRVIYPRSAPATENLRLEAPLIAGKSTGDPLRVLAGKTFGFSQLRFERDFKGVGENISLASASNRASAFGPSSPRTAATKNSCSSLKWALKRFCIHQS